MDPRPREEIRMYSYTLTHLSDRTLLEKLRSLVARDRANTAGLLAHIAEVDVRRLYAPAGCPSMYAYCVKHLHLSEDAAYKRIQAARAGRRFTVLFEALAEGRLHLSGIVLLAAHLNEANVHSLVEASADRSKSEIERLLAERFPRADVPATVRALPDHPSTSTLRLAPGQVEISDASSSNDPVPVSPDGAGPDVPADTQAAALQREAARLPVHAAPLSPGTVGTPFPRLTPRSPGRYALQVTLSKETYETLQRARELLSHRIPSGDLAQVLDRALNALVTQLEKRKCAAAARPRGRTPKHTPSRTDLAARTIPADVRRAVWARDGGRCTFRSDDGKRCDARTLLEFDHIEPLARGGPATVGGIRLRCRTHNQYEAERVFGAGFMQARRPMQSRTLSAPSASSTRQGG